MESGAQPQPGCLRRSYRFLVLLPLLFAATFTSYMLRVNLNIAIVDMIVDNEDRTNLCTANATIKGYVYHNGKYLFCWTNQQKQQILGAFFYGYFVLQVPAGALAEKLGAKVVLGATILGTALLSLITPLVAFNEGFQSIGLLIALRVVQGLFSGATYPALPPIIKRWCYEREMGKFISIAYVGGTFGTAVTYPLGGLILEKFSWQTLFYISGGVGILWFVLWILLVTDDPTTNRWIGQWEKDEIVARRSKFDPTAKKKLIPPMHKILAIPTVWICALSEFGYSIALYFVIIEGPTFIKEVLGKDIQANGILNALPSLSAFVYAQIFGLASDLAVSRDWLSKANAMRFFEGFSQLMPSIGCVLMTQFITKDWRLVIGIMCVFFGTRTGCYTGRNRVYYEILPDHSGPAFGFANMCGSIAGFVTPAMVTALTGGHESDPTGWVNLFWIAMSIMTFCGILFVTFARFAPVPIESSSQHEPHSGSDKHSSPDYKTFSR